VAGDNAGVVRPAFPSLLRAWRRKRRLSQLELALTSGVSQRHVSFLESGRAHPSRRMILQLSETLEVPLRDRNGWLTAAGFAPVYESHPLDDPRLSQVMAAVRMMLQNHAPFPAVAIDRAWNVLLTNAPFDAITAWFGPDLWQRLGGQPPNLMRLFFHPLGLRAQVVNWSAIAPLLWHRAQREAAAGGREMVDLLAELAPHQDAALTLGLAEETALVPVLPIELNVNGQAVSLFSVIATFGTAQDITTDEMRIESFFPADALTESLFRSISTGS
jgi:transcriptional regulator with XRE-family HTH domain